MTSIPGNRKQQIYQRFTSYILYYRDQSAGGILRVVTTPAEVRTVMSVNEIVKLVVSVTDWYLKPNPRGPFFKVISRKERDPEEWVRESSTEEFKAFKGWTGDNPLMRTTTEGSIPPVQDASQDTVVDAGVAEYLAAIRPQGPRKVPPRRQSSKDVIKGRVELK